jgi:hypothetical protein
MDFHNPIGAHASAWRAVHPFGMERAPLAGYRLLFRRVSNPSLPVTLGDYEILPAAVSPAGIYDRRTGALSTARLSAVGCASLDSPNGAGKSAINVILIDPTRPSDRRIQWAGCGVAHGCLIREGARLAGCAPVGSPKSDSAYRCMRPTATPGMSGVGIATPAS